MAATETRKDELFAQATEQGWTIRNNDMITDHIFFVNYYGTIRLWVAFTNTGRVSYGEVQRIVNGDGILVAMTDRSDKHATVSRWLDNYSAA